MVGNTANRILKNTGWLYAKMGITMFVSLYTTRLILTGLGAADFGIYNLVGGVIAMLGFLNSSMASSTQRFMNYAEGEGDFEKKKTIFNVSFILHLCVAAIVIIFLSVAGFFFFDGMLNIPEDRIVASRVVYICLIISTSLTITTVPYDAILNSHENMRYYSIIGIIESILKLAVAFACVYTSSDKLIVYGILMALIPFFTLSVERIYCHKHYEECVIQPKKYWDSKQAQEMTSFAGWGFVSSVASLFTMQGMSILLNMFGGVVVNAAHGIANQLAGQLMVFSNNMLKALNPVLVKSQGGGKTEQMLEAASTGSKLSCLMYTFFAVPFVVETPYILSIWLKDVPEWAVLFVRLVLIRQMVSQLDVTLGTCISATGKIRNFSIVNTIVWGSPIVIGYFLYKHGAPIYTIYILLILMVLLRAAATMYFCKKLCNLNIGRYISKTVAPCLLQTIFVFIPLIVLTYIIPFSFVRLLLVCIIGFIFHICLTYYVTLNTKERNMVTSLLNSVLLKIKKK